jgi:hypothetical protein
MMNLVEYRNRTAYLADYLPWAALIAPGVVLNKDGSRGLDHCRARLTPMCVSRRFPPSISPT